MCNERDYNNEWILYFVEIISKSHNISRVSGFYSSSCTIFWFKCKISLMALHLLVVTYGWFQLTFILLFVVIFYNDKYNLYILIPLHLLLHQFPTNWFECRNFITCSRKKIIINELFMCCVCGCRLENQVFCCCCHSVSEATWRFD